MTANTRCLENTSKITQYRFIMGKSFFIKLPKFVEDVNEKSDKEDPEDIVG